jgi:hypothetical protein
MSNTQAAVTIPSESFLEAVRRAKAEFLEMPGLKLTAAQAARLWSVDSVVCGQVLAALVESRFLAETAQASFVRAEH